MCRSPNGINDQPPGVPLRVERPVTPLGVEVGAEGVVGPLGVFGGDHVGVGVEEDGF
ncbi:hypothetical protein JHK87_006632 [Glycine soja]|uniref:Uncharacterized protein n=1 Tax=Glycine max TaxID=3847 RepID=C6TMR8_SOYBN|nr:unknown [Glycine max]KAG5042717.1 hypothetical protein JHK87_006632 [Glycine soja]KAG5071571.1 hypothetical protein JHK86_006782 [Glycine max]